MESKGVCLDTDVLIDSFKGDPREIRGYHVTCISLYEFLRGLAYLGKDVNEFKAWIEANMNVVCVDNKAIKTASRIYAELRREGNLIEDPDLLIASMCIANGLVLKTGNRKHFERLEKFGLKLV